MRLTDFLKTGSLENIKAGKSIDEITAILGGTSEAQVPLSRKDPRPAILKYDRIELYFTSEPVQRLKAVQITSSQAAPAYDLEVDYQGFADRIQLADVVQMLNRSKIPFRELNSKYRDDGIPDLVTSGNVIIQFHTPDSDGKVYFDKMNSGFNDERFYI